MLTTVLTIVCTACVSVVAVGACEQLWRQARQFWALRKRMNAATSVAELDRIMDEDRAWHADRAQHKPVPLPTTVCAIAAGVGGMAIGVIHSDLGFKLGASVLLLFGINDLQNWVRHRAHR